MDRNEFVEAVKRWVRDAAVEDVQRLYTAPPGRAPAKELLEVSRWYNALDQADKAMVERVVKESVDSALFGFLNVLDGTRAVVVNPKERGEFKLLWTNGEQQVLLNDPEEEGLHELYNS